MFAPQHKSAWHAATVLRQHPRQSGPQLHGHITQYAGCFVLQADALLFDVAGQGLLDQASKAQQLLAQVRAL
jgi:hypothetical protein